MIASDDPRRLYALQVQPGAEYRIRRWLDRDTIKACAREIAEGVYGGSLLIEPMVARDFRSAHHLERAGYETWLPEEKHRLRLRRKVITRRGPLFPGYVFIRLDLTRQSWRELEAIDGVERIMRATPGASTGRPAPLDETRIAAILAEIAEEDDGAITLGRKKRRKSRFKEGDQVRVLDGPFMDHIGIYSDDPKERANVVLALFGRPMPLQIDEARLEAVS